MFVYDIFLKGNVFLL